MLLTSCSITRHLPEGEVLYTGVERIGHHATDTLDAVVREAVATALEVPPNSALLGSAYRMSPLPIGLWFYNGLYTDRDRGFRHWLWSTFKSDPTLVSQVNPQLRARAAEAALKDEGYFNAHVDYRVAPHSQDSLRAKIAYDVTYHHPSRLGSITYLPSRSARVDSIIAHTMQHSLLHSGGRFSSSALEAERQRLAATLQDSGYYFFRPEYIRFAGDSTRRSHSVDLRVLISVGTDRKALAPCTIDSVHYKLDFGMGLRSQNHDTLRFLTVGYNGPQQVQTRYLRRALGFRRHALCTPDRLSLVKVLNARLNTFKYTTTEVEVLRQASDSVADDTTSLRLMIHATYAPTWTGTTELGAVYKDNGQAGPGVVSTITRRNLWGGGERLTTQLNASYEWRTGKGSSGSNEGVFNPQANDGGGNTLVNSYELGMKVSLKVPRLQMPRLFRPDRENPVSSNYSLSIDWTRRSGLFEMIRAGGEMSYEFSLNRVNTLSITPLKIDYVSVVKTSAEFRQMLDRISSLSYSFENQFVPQLRLSWTYDNTPTRNEHQASRWVNVTLSEAGGLVDLAMGYVGKHREQGQRQLFFQPFSQFVKATADVRTTWPLTSRLQLASRLMGGIGYAYGNSTQMPYSEQFYIGGPNSLRGFPVRGVGPGSVAIYNTLPSQYNYLSRVGDIKLEGNLELRFPIAGSLHGALFVDAGNVWKFDDPEVSDVLALDDEGWRQYFADFFDPVPSDPVDYDIALSLLRQLAQQTYDEQRMSSNPFAQMALNCGFGLRLDLGMLVLRFDVGVPLHDPGERDGGYFNCEHALLRNLGWNLAVGYPF